MVIYLQTVIQFQITDNLNYHYSELFLLQVIYSYIISSLPTEYKQFLNISISRINGTLISTIIMIWFGFFA